MTGDDLEKELERLGWSGAELGRRVGKSTTAVAQWRTGQRRVPRYVQEYLRVQGLAKEIIG